MIFSSSMYLHELYIYICILLPMHIFAYVNGARCLVIVSCPLHCTGLTRGDVTYFKSHLELQMLLGDVISLASKLPYAKCGLVGCPAWYSVIP